MNSSLTAICLDLGGTRIKVSLVQNGMLKDFHILKSYSEKGFQFLVPLIENEIESLLRNHQVSRNNFLGIGLSVPGAVDSKEKKVLKINEKFSDIVEFDFKKWANKKFATNIVIENDARAALIGEWKFGVGMGKKNLIGVTLGTGIGSAAVCDGQLLRGQNFLAGNLGGHFIVDIKGPLCTCGGIGCVEAFAGAWAIRKKAMKSPEFIQSPLSQIKDFGIKEIFNYADQRNEFCQNLRDELIEFWSLAILNLVYAYDPELVVLNGGPLEEGEYIISKIKEIVFKKNHWMNPFNLEIKKAMHLNSAALLGLFSLLISLEAKAEANPIS